MSGYCDDEENDGMGSCKTNFLNSIEKFGLGVENLNDNTINLFEKVRQLSNKLILFENVRQLSNRNRLQGRKSDAKRGDYITFKSYIDLIVSVSLCPQIDFMGGYYYNPENSKSIKISIYE